MTKKKGGKPSSAVTSPRPFYFSWFVAALFVLVAFVVWLYRQPSSQLLLMRFFRDVSRHKSRRRLLGSGTSLVAVLRGVEEPLPSALLSEQSAVLETMTSADLSWYDGSEDGRPLYVAVMGRVFDVTPSWHLYGPGRAYHVYVAKDATRGLATGCRKTECLVASLAGLGEAQVKEAERWLELYTIHDKYRFVAMLRDDPVESSLRQAALEEAMLRDASGSPLEPGDLKDKGAEAYRLGDYSNARVYWTASLGRLGALPAFLDVGSRRDHEKDRVALLNFLGALAQKEDRLDDAVSHYGEARHILEELLETELLERDISYAGVLSDEAAAYFRLSNVPKALPLLERAVTIFESTLSAKGLPVYLNTLFNLAVAHNIQGDGTTALSLLQKVVDTAARFPELDEAVVPMMEQLMANVFVGMDQLRVQLDGVADETLERGAEDGRI